MNGFFTTRTIFGVLGLKISHTTCIVGGLPANVPVITLVLLHKILIGYECRESCTYSWTLRDREVTVEEPPLPSLLCPSFTGLFVIAAYFQYWVTFPTKYEIDACLPSKGKGWSSSSSKISTLSSSNSSSSCCKFEP